jgi:hypothetical protein
VAAGDVRPRGGIVTEHGPASGFEIEAATVEEFLRLLKEREEGEASLGELRGATRRAVFVAQILDQRSTSYGYPSVRRYIVAAFAYGCDLVSYSRTTSSAVELPEIASRTAERQHEAYEEIRVEIERGLERMGLDLPVFEGSLRSSAEPGENR